MDKMQNSPENPLFVNGSWLVEVTAEQPADLEHYLNNENEELREHDRKFKLPGAIAILPIRNTVAYPGTVTPLAIGRQRSKRLLAALKTNESIIGLVTQRNPKIDRPNFDDLYSVGTAASILKVIKMPQGPIHIVVHSIARFKIVERLTTEPYLKARVKPLNVKARMTKKLQALIVSVRQTANRVIALSPNIPEEASILLENIENPSALADFLAANLSVDVAKKQQLLDRLSYPPLNFVT